MSYLSQYATNSGRTAEDARRQMWKENLEYEAALERELETLRYMRSPEALYANQPDYLRRLYGQTRFPASRHSLSQDPVTFANPGTGGEATHPNYSPWPHRGFRTRRHYHPHLHRSTDYGDSSMSFGELTTLYAAGLPAPVRPWPNPPGKPLQPPGIPGPQPYPAPAPAPAPERRYERQTRIPEYFAQSAGIHPGYQSEGQSAQGQGTRSGNARQSVAYQPPSVRDESSDSEGSRTPTQSDYVAKGSGYQSENGSAQAQTKDTEASRSKSVDVAELRQQVAGSKPNLRPQSQTRSRRGIPRWQRRAFHRMLRDDFRGFDAAKYCGLQRDPATGLFQPQKEQAEPAKVVHKGLQQSVGSEQAPAGRYDLQTPRSAD